MSDTKIKICGLFRDEDIAYVNEYKPDYAGFVFYKKSHRNLTYDRALQLKKLLAEDIKSVGVFVDEPVDNIIKLVKNNILDIVQLHGNEDENVIKRIKEETGVSIIKAVKIVSGDELIEAAQLGADYLLCDSGMGTGKAFDWDKSAQITGAKTGLPLFLAGGISCDNVKEAIDIFKPYAVDLSSSVETEKVKDPDKIKEIIRIVREL